jgi:Protein of unknown function (DUF3105)
MAKAKKKRRRPAAARTAPAAAAAPSNAARRERKEAKREADARAAKAAARRGTYRRALIGGFVGLLVFVAISWFNRAPAPTPLSVETLAAAKNGGCDALTQPTTDPQRNHLDSGQPYDYAEHPATSGPHDPTPLPDEPRVYTDIGSYRETQAVHSLEHGSVIMYYRPSADPHGLARPVVDALTTVAQGGKATYLIPYPDLPAGDALAYTAWNQLLTCPAGIGAADATTVANGFIASFACTSNAPEGKNGPGC